jgi:hypothetical protein
MIRNFLFIGFPIFIVNTSLTNLYLLGMEFPSNISDFSEQYCFVQWSTICFIPDIVKYAGDIAQININDIGDNLFKINGGASLHSFIYLFSTPDNLMGYSLIVNSFFCALFFISIKKYYTLSLKRVYLWYLFLLPFFIIYSVGPTKEILLLLGCVIFINSDSKFLSPFSLLIIILARSIMLPVIILSKYFKFTIIRIVISFILISITLPFFYLYLGYSFFLYDPNKLSQYIESLKYSTSFFGFIGLFTAGLKNLLEPYIYLVKTWDFSNIILLLNFIYFSKFYYDLILIHKKINLLTIDEFKFYILKRDLITKKDRWKFSKNY